MTSPLVSVVLSVHNGAGDLPKAIETILTQSFVDFELIAINNGSTDDTATVLDGIRDRRVRVFHQKNIGLAGALNRGISLARGQYIARQDHDDWARPTRIEKQVAFMEANPDCGLVGTWAEIWVGDQATDRVHDHPADNAALQFELLFDSHFVHSSVMMRRSALEIVGLYPTDPARQPPEDFDLWSRIARRYRVANLPERLTIYREVPNSLSREPRTAFSERVALVSAENLAAATGEAAPGRNHWDIAALFHRVPGKLSANPDIENMCQIIREAGDRIHAKCPSSDVPRRVSNRINTLRSRYIEQRRLGKFGLLRRVVGLARRSSGIRKIKRRLFG